MEVLLPLWLPNFSWGRIIVVLVPVLWVFARDCFLLLADVLLVASYLAVVRNGPAPFKEHNNACYVIDGVFLPFPGCHWFFDNGATSTFEVISVPERHNKVDNLFTGEEFPDTIGGQDQELIFVSCIELEYFYKKKIQTPLPSIKQRKVWF